MISFEVGARMFQFLDFFHHAKRCNQLGYPPEKEVSYKSPVNEYHVEVIIFRMTVVVETTLCQTLTWAQHIKMKKAFWKFLHYFYLFFKV